MKNLFRDHPRLWVSVVVGAALFLLLPREWSALSRVLVCWNCGVMLFLGLLSFWMMRLSADQICKQYIEEDESGSFILVIVVLAAMLSLVAIIEPLATIKQVSGAERIAHFALAALTLVDRFYSVDEKHRPLRFPDTDMPVFWDFAYFSFTIAAACQTSDVSTTNAEIRRIVIAHTLISFLFNATILGFAINVTAGLIGGS
jgi:uncharacterized membrane protein